MRRWRTLGLFALAAGWCVQCGGGGQGASQDRPLPKRFAHPEEDAGADAATLTEGEAGVSRTNDPPCATDEPFGTPKLVAGIDPDILAATPRLSHDELAIYFTTHETGERTDSQLAMATRKALLGAFGPVTIMPQSSVSNDNDPSVGGDHLTLWFHSSRGGNADLYQATRATTASDFGLPSPVPGVNTPAPEAHAYYLKQSGELWFVSNRGDTLYDIYVAKKEGAGFATPEIVPELSSEANDWQPQPSEDGLRILIASDRPGGAGKMDLYLARRTSTSAPFGTPEPLTELNSDAVDQAGWISPDGCRIYFSSGRASADEHQQLFVAERPKS